MGYATSNNEMGVRISGRRLVSCMCLIGEVKHVEGVWEGQGDDRCKLALDGVITERILLELLRESFAFL